MTNQDAFDKMMEHLRSLKERSFDKKKDHCVYNGSKCAVGALMTDEEQEEYGDYEGGVFCLLEEMEEDGHDSALHALDYGFLSKMQYLHDNEANWSYEGFVAAGFTAEDKAKMIANKHNLIYTKP